MMRRVDPAAELTAAALPDVDWDTRLLSRAGQYLQWISIHGYWDNIHETNALASYDRCMAYTGHLEDSVRKVRGLLMAFGLEKKIRIAFDEWNLRGWYHPNSLTVYQPVDPAEYLSPRDDNDKNASYTMADAVFSACFLNMALRNGDIVGMANFAPAVNTRGAIYTWEGGIVLRPTYHVFDLYANLLGDEVIAVYETDVPQYRTTDGLEGPAAVPMLDAVATRSSADGTLAVACVNKHATQAQTVNLTVPCDRPARVTTLDGASENDYNDIGRDSVHPRQNDAAAARIPGGWRVTLPPHSVNVVRI